MFLCSFHPEIQPREIKYITLDDGRKLCLECLTSSIMDTPECQHLYMDIQEFFEGLNMKVEQQIPILLVERQALNEALEAEKNVSGMNWLFGAQYLTYSLTYDILFCFILLCSRGTTYQKPEVYVFLKSKLLER
jgi:hypothetical protein